MVLVDYPSENEELEIVKRTTADVATQLTSALSAKDIVEMSRIVRRVPVADHLARYAIQFARRTRVGYGDVPQMVRDYVSWGAGPRASQYLVLAAKARAVLHGRYYVSGDDIRAVAPAVLRHRIVTNFNAEAEGLKSDDIVAHLTKTIPVAEDTHAA
jgi:MoxR-like ATPase